MIKNDYYKGFFNKYFFKDMKNIQEINKIKDKLPISNKVLKIY